MISSATSIDSVMASNFHLNHGNSKDGCLLADYAGGRFFYYSFILQRVNSILAVSGLRQQQTLLCLAAVRIFMSAV